VAVVDMFTREERDLLDWGEGMRKSAGNATALAWPVAVLINGETTGAAEALAAVLRMVGSGLLLGNPTRGAALLPREFTLADGRRLCVGSIPVRLGDQAKSELGPVTPDITVEVSLAQEREYQADPYRAAGDEGRETGSTGGRTNAVAQRVRISEAELVRSHRESNGVTQQKPPESKPDSPVIADPVLARAVDLLKGLAVFRRAQ
jgi:C-terminal processing protease CtpA/Prc